MIFGRLTQRGAQQRRHGVDRRRGVIRPSTCDTPHVRDFQRDISLQKILFSCKFLAPSKTRFSRAVLSSFKLAEMWTWII